MSFDTLPLDVRASLRRRGRWSFDPETASYIDPDGQTVPLDDIDGALRRFLERQRVKAEDLTVSLGDGTTTLPEWEHEMRWVIKDAYGASYMLGRGGRNVMTPRDWGRVGRRVRDQYEYLSTFASELSAGSVSRAQAVQRANLYPLSAKQAHSRGHTTALGDPSLPAYPGDGSTACYSNCGCHWRIDKTTFADGSAGWDCTWVRGKLDSCVDCVQREQEWAPLVVHA